MGRLSRSRTGPSGPRRIGAIAVYGPDTTLATKLVASVFDASWPKEPLAMRTWTTVSVDVRHDPAIAAGAAALMREHGVEQSIGGNRIIGCPHQEGIDYPMGRTCPQCPFWAGIDRFTHEPIVVPAPTMSPSEILSALSEDASFQPEEALASADGHREALVQPLLEAIDRGITDPEGASAADANLFSYALYLLAKWREPRAYPCVIRWLSLPPEQPFQIAGDIVTEDGARILAAVCDQDLEPIKGLILNPLADEYGRSAGVTALALLAAWAEVPRQPIVDYFVWLAREGLEREPSAVWDSLASDSADLEALALFPELRRAYDEGLVDPLSMDPEELAAIESAPRGLTIEAMRDGRPPIDEVAAATSWWSAFAEEDDWDAEDDEDGEIVEPQEPYRAPPKVGRNEPCPCGSGKKYKKCCGS